MSAFMVSDDHLSLLASAAIQWGYSVNGAWFSAGVNKSVDGAGQQLVNLLHAENAKAFCHRYKLNGGVADAPKFKPMYAHLSPLQVLKAVQCFNYQASQTEEYDGSEAAKLVDGIIGNGIRALPGYDEAQWDFSL